MGTAILLNTALRYWKKMKSLNTSRFHHISTDEVYGSLGAEGFFTEESPYSPNSPYSSSKASSSSINPAVFNDFGFLSVLLFPPVLNQYLRENPLGLSPHLPQVLQARHIPLQYLWFFLNVLSGLLYTFLNTHVHCIDKEKPVHSVISSIGI